MPAQGISTYESGAWEIDLARRELRSRGNRSPLGGRAFDIVEVLIQSAGELVTKDEMMSRVWPGATVGENTLQVHISAVRKALGADRWMLKTTTGRGYRLLGDWTASAARATQPVYPSPPRTPATPARPIFPPLCAPRRPGPRLCQLRDLVSAYRVVTLTGPGGIGKTTLAMKAARASSANLPTAAGSSNWPRCPIPASCRPRWPACFG